MGRTIIEECDMCGSCDIFSTIKIRRYYSASTISEPKHVWQEVLLCEECFIKLNSFLGYDLTDSEKLCMNLLGSVDYRRDPDSKKLKYYDNIINLSWKTVNIKDFKKKIKQVHYSNITAKG